MSYNALAQYYDLLVKDEQATLDWANFTERYIKGKSILELACGSGEISIELANRGYQVEATDLSQEMIDQANHKVHPDSIRFSVMDMRQLDKEGPYDAILCYCDSLNYLQSFTEVKQLFHQCHTLLKEDGVLLFDMHSQDRLQEFQEEYIEEGALDQVGYQWTIQSDDPYIYQHFVFWTETGLLQEHHAQLVFAPEQVREALIVAGFQFEVFTDFVKPGINPGEKYFYIGRKQR